MNKINYTQNEEKNVFFRRSFAFDLINMQIRLTSASVASSAITCVWDPVGVKSDRVFDADAISM